MKNLSLQADVLIVGAGMAGIMAGLAASREGAKVVLAEMSFTPGGQATSTMLSEMSGIAHRGQNIYGGIENELISRLVGVRSAEYNYDVPLLPHPTLTSDRLFYNPETLKILLDWFTLASDIHAIGGCVLQSAEERPDGVRATMRGGSELIEVAARVAIDATGNATLTQKAGFETYRNMMADQEVATLLFRLSDTNHEALRPFMKDESMYDVVQKGYDEGYLPGCYLSITPVPGTKDVMVNATRAVVDYESSSDITKAMITMRNQLLKIIPFLKACVPGLEEASLAAMGSTIGIREGRRILGVTEVTEQDIMESRFFADSVALTCAPMGIHDPVRDEVDWKKADNVSYIPYSAMIPRKANRIIAAGKCISSDSMAATALRCIPTVMNTGEVAGYAAAMAVRQNRLPAELDAKELRTLLVTKGINVRGLF